MRKVLLLTLLATFLTFSVVAAEKGMEIGKITTDIEEGVEIEEMISEELLPSNESANVSVNVTQEVEVEHEVEVKGNETEVSVEVEHEVEVETEVEPAKPSVIEKCVELLKSSPLNDGNFTEEQLELICEFLRGVRKKVRREQERIMRCVAEAHLANPNVPFGILKRRCIEKAWKEKVCPEVEVPECEEGYPEPKVDERGCVVEYECVKREKNTFEFKLMKCVREAVKRGLKKREAVRRCFTQLGSIPAREVGKRIVARKIPLSVIVKHLKCAQLPPEIKKDVEALLKEALQIKAKILRRSREIMEACIGNVTEEELASKREECKRLVKEATEDLRRREEEILLELHKFYDLYKRFVDGRCVSELVSARKIVERYREKRMEIISDPNLTIEEKEKLLEELARNMTEELKNRMGKEEGKEYVKEAVKGLFEEEDAKKLVLRMLKKKRELIREILKDPEIREEIVWEIAENPRDIELLKEALENAEAKARIVNETLRNGELKKKIYENVEILRKVLPKRLHARLSRIRIKRMLAENETVVRAEIEEDGRLFLIIPVKVPKIVRFSGDQLLEERGPWWAFLVS